MFNSLIGHIAGHRFPLVYIRTGGVEWQVEVSAGTFQSVLSAEGECRIFTYLHSREDLLRLYGFWTERERAVFLELISVSGIGPKQALKILSGTTAESLVAFLESEDIPSLTRIPGLGKKTAQRLILQLKGHLIMDEESGQGTGGTVRHDMAGELLQALMDMGFDRKKAETVLNEVSTELADHTFSDDRSREQELFRRAIVALSGK